MTVTTAMASTFELLQGQLKGYKNVDVGFELIQPAALVPKLQNGEYDAATYALYADDIEPTMYEYYHSKGKLNFTGISDPELDAALEAGRAADRVSN